MTTNPNPDPRVKHLRDAQRRVRSALIANADRLSTPFTDDPGKNPWDTFVRPAMRELKAAVDAVAVSSAVSVVPPATNQTALRDRIADALISWTYRGKEPDPGIGMLETVRANAYSRADAVLAVLPAPADRAATLREAADALGRMDYDTDSRDYGYDTYRDAWNGGVMDGADLLRGLAVEAGQAGGPSREAAEAPHTATPDAHSCGNCDGIDPDSCLTNLDRPAVKAQQAATKTPDEEPGQWCKCRSCWGWFVEEHPGEDLDELGRDLGWWSGLPEHRDAPAVVAQPGKEHGRG